METSGSDLNATLPRPDSARFVNSTLNKLDADLARAEAGDVRRGRRIAGSRKAALPISVLARPSSALQSRFDSCSDSAFVQRSVPAGSDSPALVEERAPSKELTLRAPLPRLSSAEAPPASEPLQAQEGFKFGIGGSPEHCGGSPLAAERCPIRGNWGWREALREELSSGVHELKRALSDANIATVVRRFTEWREHDEARTNRLREDLEEMFKKHEALRQGQIDWLSSKGAHIQRAAYEMIDDAVRQAADACDQSVRAATERCVEQVEALREDVVQLTSTLGKQQHTAERLLVLEKRLNGLAGEIAESVLASSRGHCHSELSSAPDAVVEATTTRLWGKTITEIHRVEHERDRVVADICKLEFEAVASSLEIKFQQSLQSAAKGAGHSDGLSEQTQAALETISQQLLLHGSRVDNACKCLQEEGTWVRSRVDFWAGKHELAETKFQQLQECHKTSQQDIQNLQAQLHTSQEDLELNQIRLASASARTGIDIIQRIKTIEMRGNIEVNLKNGDVNILKPLEFKARKKAETPSAEFVDVSLASQILEDIAELQLMFNSPIEVEGHTRGSTDEFFKKLAANRAELIVKHLASRGVEKRLMTPKGLPGTMGVNKPCVIVRLDIFPDND